MINSAGIFWYNSPVGVLRLESGGDSLTVCAFETVPHTVEEGDNFLPDSIIKQSIRELDAYFAGELTVFTVPLRPAGTDFRRRAWAELQKIPYGETISYAQLAQRVGNPKAARAVGGANHHNPIVIIIPCHRVVGADGGLTGYGGGLERKKFLLWHEQRHA